MSSMFDVLLLGLLLYRIYRLLAGTTSVKALAGFLLLVAAYFIAGAVGLPLLTAILGRLMDVGILVFVVIFQKEIRRVLLWVGDVITWRESKVLGRFLGNKKSHKQEIGVTPIVEAAKTLAGSNTGALIVLSNRDPLHSFQESGEPIGAAVSKRLLLAIFNKESPLHDGGVIIYDNKIAAARCILPVTERQDVPEHLGLRHRAAIGMTEVTDALVLIVSEETGQISVARSGVTESNLSTQETRAAVYDYLTGKART
ncbi:MAG: diadenylate cyclase CdaA [Bacteroidota bacterium]